MQLDFDTETKTEDLFQEPEVELDEFEENEPEGESAFSPDEEPEEEAEIKTKRGGTSDLAQRRQEISSGVNAATGEGAPNALRYRRETGVYPRGAR
jgi:hypothetical protein